MSAISERQKLYIGLGVILFILAGFFLCGIYAGHYLIGFPACPKCVVCEENDCSEEWPPCPIAGHESVEIVLYPTASVACNKAPESDRWLCSPVVFKNPDGEPGKMPREVTVRLLEPPEAAAKKDKGL